MATNYFVFNTAFPPRQTNSKPAMCALIDPAVLIPNTDERKEANNDLIISYLTLRNLIGILGMLLPLILMVATSKMGTDKGIESSISAYYYTSSGELFVVIVSTLAVFLFTYTGYNRAENWWTTLAGVGALGVAFFPTSSADTSRNAFSVHTARPVVPEFLGLIEWHFLFATLFFSCIAVMSLFYFTKKNATTQLEVGGKKTQKAKRNVVYIVCGWVIIGCIVCIGINFFVDRTGTALGNFPTVFVLEAVAVEAFGLSWLTKGGTLWPDGKSYILKLLKFDKQ